MAWQSLEELKFYQSFRLPVESDDDLRCVLALASREIPVIVGNISEGGLGVSAQEELPIGLKVQAQLVFRKVRAEVDAEIVRAMPLKDSKYFSYGLRLEPDQDLQKLMQQFVASLSPERLKHALASAVRRHREEGASHSFELFSLLFSTWQDLSDLSAQKKFVDTMLSELVFHVDAAWAAVFLINPEKNCLELKSQYGLAAPLAQTWSFDYRQGVAGAVFTSGRMLNIDASAQNSLGIQDASLETALARPLFNGDDKVIGVLQVANKRSQHRFSLADEKLLRLMGLVLENVWSDLRPFAAKSQVRQWSAAYDRELVLIGQSPFIRFLRNSITRCKDASAPILCQGEKGTGRTLLGKIFHAESGRAVHPLLIWDAALLHTKLADAGSGEKWLAAQIKAAQGGSLIIQNIEDLGLTEQQWLLEIFPRMADAQIRICATTQVDLTRLDSTKFLPALAAGWPQVINFAPLRTRMEDFRDLANYFVKKVCQEKGLLEKIIAPKVWTALQGYYWPGNVAELKQVITSLVAWHEKDHTIVDLTLPGQPPLLTYGPVQEFNASFTYDAALTLPERMALVERELILLEIKRQQGNKSHAAKALGISREALRKKLLHSEQVFAKWQAASSASSASAAASSSQAA